MNDSFTLRPMQRAHRMWSVSPAHPGQANDLAALAAALFPHACPPGLSHTAIAAHVASHFSPAAVRTWFAPGHHCFVVHDPSQALAGYALLIDGTAMDRAAAACLTLAPTTGVSKFYLAPQARGTGVADLLMNALIVDACARGLAGMWIATHSGNARARAFYARSGFVECGTRTFWVNDVPHDDVVAEMSLSGLRHDNGTRSRLAE